MEIPEAPYAEPPRPTAFADLPLDYAALTGVPMMTREQFEADRAERRAEDEAYATNALRDLLIGHGCPEPYVDVVVLPVLLKAFRVSLRQEIGNVTSSGLLVHPGAFVEQPEPRWYRSLALFSPWEAADV